MGWAIGIGPFPTGLDLEKPSGHRRLDFRLFNLTGLVLTTLFLGASTFLFAFFCLRAHVGKQIYLSALGEGLPITQATAVTTAASGRVGPSLLGLSATLIYVASYAGTITTFNLTVPSSGAASLDAIATSTGCSGNSSWLTFDAPNNVLYCVNEGFTGPSGTLSSYKTGPNGTLTQIVKVQTDDGPVSAIIYGDRGQGIAVAH